VESSLLEGLARSFPFIGVRIQYAVRGGSPPWTTSHATTGTTEVEDYAARKSAQRKAESFCRVSLALVTRDEHQRFASGELLSLVLGDRELQRVEGP
jgi:hypothetical protein